MEVTAVKRGVFQQIKKSEMRRVTQKLPICVALLAYIATSATAFAREPIYFVRASEDSAPGVPERTLKAAGYDLLTGDERRGDAFLFNYAATFGNRDGNGRVATFNSIAMMTYACFVGGRLVIVGGQSASRVEVNTETSFAAGKKMDARAAKNVTEDAIEWLKSPAAKELVDDCAYIRAHFKS